MTPWRPARTTKNGSTYWREYADAREVLETLLPDYPEARIVSYELGHAIQQRKSGSYWNANTSSF